MEEESGGGAGAATPGAPPPGSFRALLSGRKSDMKVLPQKKRTSTGAGDGFISLDFGDDESGAKPGVGEEGAGEGQAGGKRRREDEAEIKPVRNSFGEDFLSLEDLGEPRSLKKKSTSDEVSSTSGGCEWEIEENYNKKSPWARGRAYQNSCKDRCVSLHHEICDFVEFIQVFRPHSSPTLLLNHNNSLAMHITVTTPPSLDTPCAACAGRDEEKRRACGAFASHYRAALVRCSA